VTQSTVLQPYFVSSKVLIGLKTAGKIPCGFKLLAAAAAAAAGVITVAKCQRTGQIVLVHIEVLAFGRINNRDTAYSVQIAHSLFPKLNLWDRQINHRNIK
jgi:hypothetical protein